MTKYTHRPSIRCTKRFKELVNEIGHKAGFVQLKRGQTYARKKGFSALLNEVYKGKRIEIEGDYKANIDKLKRICVNHSSNVSQLLNSIGHVSFQADGKSYSISKFITEYYSSAEIALQFVNGLTDSKPYYETSKLDLIQELIDECEKPNEETYLTFQVTDEVHQILIDHKPKIRGIGYIFEKIYVKARTFSIDEQKTERLKKYESIFENFNSLTTQVNGFLLKKQEPPYTKIASNLLALKKNLDATNEKDNDH